MCVCCVCVSRAWASLWTHVILALPTSTRSLLIMWHVFRWSATRQFLLSTDGRFNSMFCSVISMLFCLTQNMQTETALRCAEAFTCAGVYLCRCFVYLCRCLVYLCRCLPVQVFTRAGVYPCRCLPVQVFTRACVYPCRCLPVHSSPPELRYCRVDWHRFLAKF